MNVNNNNPYEISNRVIAAHAPSPRQKELKNEKLKYIIWVFQKLRDIKNIDLTEFVGSLESTEIYFKKSLQDSFLKEDPDLILRSNIHSIHQLNVTKVVSLEQLKKEAENMSEIKKLLSWICCIEGIIYCSSLFKFNDAQNKFKESFNYGDEGYYQSLRAFPGTNLTASLLLQLSNAKDDHFFPSLIKEYQETKSLTYVTPTALLNEICFKFYEHLALNGYYEGAKEYAKFLETGFYLEGDRPIFKPSLEQAFVWTQKALILAPDELEKSHTMKKLDEISKKVFPDAHLNERKLEEFFLKEKDDRKWEQRAKKYWNQLVANSKKKDASKMEIENLIN